MNKLSYNMRTISFVLLLFFICRPLIAGDEDMNPSAYQIFDPVTGFVIDVDEDYYAQQIHSDASVLSSHDENMEGGEESSIYTQYYFVFGVVFALALIGGGVVYFFRKKSA